MDAIALLQIINHPEKYGSKSPNHECSYFSHNPVSTYGVDLYIQCKYSDNMIEF